MNWYCTATRSSATWHVKPACSAAWSCQPSMQQRKQTSKTEELTRLTQIFINIRRNINKNSFVPLRRLDCRCMASGSARIKISRGNCVFCSACESCRQMSKTSSFKQNNWSKNNETCNGLLKGIINKANVFAGENLLYYITIAKPGCAHLQGITLLKSIPNIFISNKTKSDWFSTNLWNFITPKIDWFVAQYVHFVFCNHSCVY